MVSSGFSSDLRMHFGRQSSSLTHLLLSKRLQTSPEKKRNLQGAAVSKLWKEGLYFPFDSSCLILLHPVVLWLMDATSRLPFALLFLHSGWRMFVARSGERCHQHHLCSCSGRGFTATPGLLEKRLPISEGGGRLRNMKYKQVNKMSGSTREKRDGAGIPADAWILWALMLYLPSFSLSVDAGALSKI